MPTPVQPGSGDASSAYQLSRSRILARNDLNRATADMATLKARTSPPASDDELAAQSRIVEDAQLRYDQLMEAGI